MLSSKVAPVATRLLISLLTADFGTRLSGGPSLVVSARSLSNPQIDNQQRGPEPTPSGGGPRGALPSRATAAPARRAPPWRAARQTARVSAARASAPRPRPHPSLRTSRGAGGRGAPRPPSLLSAACSFPAPPRVRFAQRVAMPSSERLRGEARGSACLHFRRRLSLPCAIDRRTGCVRRVCFFRLVRVRRAYSLRLLSTRPV